MIDLTNRRRVALTLFVLFHGVFTRLGATEYVNLADVPCGRSEIREARIIGGRDATPHEFPFLVSIVRKGGHFCGGTIINSKYVMTAAHCLCSGTNKIPTGQLRVMLGQHNLKASEVPAVRQESVINAVLHPGHRCGKYVDDIALLELARPINWSESVRPACLPVATGKPGYSAFGGMEATVAGWGWLGEDRSKYKRANVLQKVDVRVIENAVCSEWYASEGKSIRVENVQMCAGYEEGGRDSCWADSGGPLIVRNRSTEPQLVVGIVSTGIGCGRLRLPGIYTRISNYVPWITRETRKS